MSDSNATARLTASDNRQSRSAAIAAGILAIGDEHGGAGEGCMAVIEEGRRDGIAWRRPPCVRSSAPSRAGCRARHRVHTTDPRVQGLFEGARIIEERKARLVFE